MAKKKLPTVYIETPRGRDAAVVDPLFIPGAVESGDRNGIVFQTTSKGLVVATFDPGETIKLDADVAIRMAKAVVVNSIPSGPQRENIMEYLQSALRIVRVVAEG